MKKTRINLSERQLREFADLEPNLFGVFVDLIGAWPGREVYITSIYRTAAEDKKLKASGVHSTNPHRAMDIRITNLGVEFQDKANTLAEVINAIWSYDSKRPQMNVLFTRPHGSAPHAHLQVHKNTERRLVQ